MKCRQLAAEGKSNVGKDLQAGRGVARVHRLPKKASSNAAGYPWEPKDDAAPLPAAPRTGKRASLLMLKRPSTSTIPPDSEPAFSPAAAAASSAPPLAPPCEAIKEEEEPSTLSAFLKEEMRQLKEDEMKEKARAGKGSDASSSSSSSGSAYSLYEEEVEEESDFSVDFTVDCPVDVVEDEERMRRKVLGLSSKSDSGKGG